MGDDNNMVENDLDCADNYVDKDENDDRHDKNSNNTQSLFCSLRHSDGTVSPTNLFSPLGSGDTSLPFQVRCHFRHSCNNSI